MAVSQGVNNANYKTLETFAELNALSTAQQGLTYVVRSLNNQEYLAVASGEGNFVNLNGLNFVVQKNQLGEYQDQAFGVVPDDATDNITAYQNIATILGDGDVLRITGRGARRLSDEVVFDQDNLTIVSDSLAWVKLAAGTQSVPAIFRFTGDSPVITSLKLDGNYEEVPDRDADTTLLHIQTDGALITGVWVADTGLEDDCSGIYLEGNNHYIKSATVTRAGKTFIRESGDRNRISGVNIDSLGPVTKGCTLIHKDGAGGATSGWSVYGPITLETDASYGIKLLAGTSYGAALDVSLEDITFEAPNSPSNNVIDLNAFRSLSLKKVTIVSGAPETDLRLTGGVLESLQLEDVTLSGNVNLEGTYGSTAKISVDGISAIGTVHTTEACLRLVPAGSVFIGANVTLSNFTTAGITFNDEPNTDVTIDDTVVMPNLTATEIQTLGSPRIGQAVYNTTLNQAQVLTVGGWVAIDSDTGIASLTDFDDLVAFESTGAWLVGQKVSINKYNMTYERVATEAEGQLTIGSTEIALHPHNTVIDARALGCKTNSWVEDCGAVLNAFTDRLPQSPRGFGQSYDKGVEIVFVQDDPFDTTYYRFLTSWRIHCDNLTFGTVGEVFLVKDFDCGLEPAIRIGRDDYQAAAEGGDTIWPGNITIKRLRMMQEGEGLALDIAGGTNSHYGHIWISGRSGKLSSFLSDGVRFGQLQTWTLDKVETLNINGVPVTILSDDAAQAHVSILQMAAKGNGYELWELQFMNPTNAVPIEIDGTTTVTGATSGATAVIRAVRMSQYDPTSQHGAYGVQEKIGEFVNGEDLMVDGTKVAEALVGAGPLDLAPVIPNGNLVIERKGSIHDLYGGITGLFFGQIDTPRFYSLDIKEVGMGEDLYLGELVIPPEYMQRDHPWQIYAKCITPGTTDGAAQPVWPTTPGATFFHGTAELQVFERAPRVGILTYVRNKDDYRYIDNTVESDGSSSYHPVFTVGAWFNERINRYSLECRGGTPKIKIGTMYNVGVLHTGVGGIFTNHGANNESYLSVDAIQELNPSQADGGTIETTTMLHNWGGRIRINQHDSTRGRDGSGWVWPPELDGRKMSFGFTEFDDLPLVYTLDHDHSPQSLPNWEPDTAYSVGDAISATSTQRLNMTAGATYELGEYIASADGAKRGKLLYNGGNGAVLGILLDENSEEFEVGDTITGLKSGGTSSVNTTGARRTNAYMVCTTAGTSGSIEPPWALNPTYGNTVVDNDVVWEYTDYGTGKVSQRTDEMVITHGLPSKVLLPTKVETSWDTGVTVTNLDNDQVKLTFTKPAPFGNGGCIRVRFTSHKEV